MSRLENVLEDCFIRLRSGEATVEECLAQYPEHAEELRRLFATAQHLNRGRGARPSPAFKARTRTQLLTHMKARPRNRLGRWLANLRLYPTFSRAMNTSLGLAAVLFLFITTGSVLAQRALPGEALYEWKIATEEIVQAIYPDSLKIDLIVSERRNLDLTQVVSDPKAREVAIEEYQEALDDLSTHTEPEARKIISSALTKQKENLKEANVEVPALDHLISKIEDQPPARRVQEADLQFSYEATTVQAGVINYNVTVTNQGPKNSVTATLVSSLAPAETLVSVDSQWCEVVEGGTVTCTLPNLEAGRSQNLTLTTQVNSCYSGAIVHTATVTGTEGIINLNTDYQKRVETDFTAPFPRPARVVFVQSNERDHNLGLVASTADPLNYNLHEYAAAPAWSPDGTKLAFFGKEGISELAGVYTAGNGVWVVDMSGVEGKNPRLLLGQDHIKSLAWSPDGRKLAIEVGPPDLPREIWIIDAQDGQELKRLVGEQPAWSPDSQQLIIKSCEPGCGLWRVDLESDRREQVTFDGTDSYPAWSPDGQYLLFSSLDRAGNWEIYRLRWEDGEILRLTNRPGSDTTPVFGPCGEEVYLRTDQYGSWWITAMTLDGTDEYKIQEGVGTTQDWGLARPAVR